MGVSILKDSRSITFSFNNNRKEDSYYIVRVEVYTIEYENKEEYYDIQYVYDFNQGSLENHDDVRYFQTVMHPLYMKGGITLDNPVNEVYDLQGVIAVKNGLTTSMVNYLLMSDYELQSQIGDTSLQTYRQNIILALSYFWDE